MNKIIKKRILSAIVSLALINGGYSQKLVSSNFKTGWEKYNLMKKVEFYSEGYYTAEVRFGEIQSTTLIEKLAVKFDDKGNKIEEKLYSSDSSLLDHVAHAYNDQGNLIESKLYDYKGVKKNITTYKYNDKGNLIEENFCKVEGVVKYARFYVYDVKGNRIEKSYYSDGILEDKTLFNYDSKGNCISWNEFDKAGNLQGRRTFFFDNIGNLVEERHYYNENLQEKSVFKYDAMGNKIETYKLSSDKTTTKIKYDVQGNQIEQTQYNSSSDTAERKTSYKYDDKNNLIEEIYEDGNFKRRKHWIYEYDLKMNWTKKIAYVDDTPEAVLIREYEYFD